MEGISREKYDDTTERQPFEESTPRGVRVLRVRAA